MWVILCERHHWKVDANDLGGKDDGIDVVSDQDGVDAMDDDGPMMQEMAC